MTDGSKDLARELFEAALEIPAGRQAEFIREACSGDRELEQRLLRLLDAHHRETAMSSPVAGESVPEQIGPYRILESIGEGGMGVVYIAEQTEPVRRRVALKIIKAGMESKEIIARFESERQALARVGRRKSRATPRFAARRSRVGGQNHGGAPRFAGRRVVDIGP